MGENRIREYTIENITLWLLLLDQISEAEFEEMYLLCSEERRRKIDKIKLGTKQKQSVGAGYLAALLKRRFSITEEITVLPGGKPVFRGNEKVHFNISHSRNMVLLAFGERPLGVDIEYVEKANLKIAKRFFTEEEYIWLSGLEEEEQKNAFGRIWTGKEAVVKAAGGGLSVPLNKFSVLEKTVVLSGERYELYRQKVMAERQSAWICVAQLIADSPETIRCNLGQKERTPHPGASASDERLLSGK